MGKVCAYGPGGEVKPGRPGTLPETGLLRRLVEHTTEHGMTFDLTLATLEWSESLVLQSRHREAIEVLQEAYPLIEQWGAPMDILRAWKLVEESIRQRVIHHQSFRDLALTIRRRWHWRN
jgi:hypothetical protein